jgi:hypothetical protein
MNKIPEIYQRGDFNFRRDLSEAIEQSRTNNSQQRREKMIQDTMQKLLRDKYPHWHAAFSAGMLQSKYFSKLRRQAVSLTTQLEQEDLQRKLSRKIYPASQRLTLKPFQKDLNNLTSPPNPTPIPISNLLTQQASIINYKKMVTNSIDCSNLIQTLKLPKKNLNSSIRDLQRQWLSGFNEPTWGSTALNGKIFWEQAFVFLVELNLD